VLAVSDGVQCTKYSKPFHITCSSISGLTGNNLNKRCASWLCTTCENSKNRNSQTDYSFSDSSDTDYLTKINSIFSAANEIKISISKHESSFTKLNNKLDGVSNQLRVLGDRTADPKNRVTHIENHLSSLKSSLEEGNI